MRHEMTAVGDRRTSSGRTGLDVPRVALSSTGWRTEHRDGEAGEELSGLGAGDGTHDPASVDTVCGDDALDLLREVRGGESERATTLEAVAVRIRCR